MALDDSLEEDHGHLAGRFLAMAVLGVAHSRCDSDAAGAAPHTAALDALDLHLGSAVEQGILDLGLGKEAWMDRIAGLGSCEREEGPHGVGHSERLSGD